MGQDIKITLIHVVYTYSHTAIHMHVHTHTYIHGYTSYLYMFSGVKIWYQGPIGCIPNLVSTDQTII